MMPVIWIIISWVTATSITLLVSELVGHGDLSNIVNIRTSIGHSDLISIVKHQNLSGSQQPQLHRKYQRVFGWQWPQKYCKYQNISINPNHEFVSYAPRYVVSGICLLTAQLCINLTIYVDVWYSDTCRCLTFWYVRMFDVWLYNVYWWFDATCQETQVTAEGLTQGDRLNRLKAARRRPARSAAEAQWVESHSTKQCNGRWQYNSTEYNKYNQYTIHLNTGQCNSTRRYNSTQGSVIVPDDTTQHRAV